MEVTVAQAGVDLLFCNSFLQHNPTPLAGHRQEKTKKCNLNKKKRMTPQNHPLKLV